MTLFVSLLRQFFSSNCSGMNNLVPWDFGIFWGILLHLCEYQLL